MLPSNTIVVLLAIILVALPRRAAAFGAGNIASVSALDGHAFRHGDIENTLKAIAFLYGRRWTSMMVKRVYFGNWLRDYSQAVDVGTLKNVQLETIRVLIWILSFMTFGYATAEFEVTHDRLGCYLPVEHIDNPKGYADDADARQFDSRLRGPVDPQELAIDLRTGMKNYIANEDGFWSTSLGYVKYSFTRSIHFGRVYIAGAAGTRGNDADLHEALRCLGQGLHTLEDFGAHTNYVELCLREMGHLNVFPFSGSNTMLNVQGKSLFPLVTGTFGAVDFLHSVIGELGDHVAQSEVAQMNRALQDARSHTRSQGHTAEQQARPLTDVLSKIPGAGGLCREAINLQRASDVQDATNNSSSGPPTFAPPPTDGHQAPTTTEVDPQAVVKKIYPILAFRDNLVRFLASIVEKIPGLEKLIDTISERITLFVMSLLAPYITPLINAASNNLKLGSSAVVSSSKNHQFEVFDDPNCNDPTHSLLSKDHFSNTLNEPAGKVASAVLQWIVPRLIYMWENPDVPVEQFLNDVATIFHHPALRQQNCEIHQIMFATVERWVQALPDRGTGLDTLLSAQSVREGSNLETHGSQAAHSHGSGIKIPEIGELDAVSTPNVSGPGNSSAYQTSYSQSADALHGAAAYESTAQPYGEANPAVTPPPPYDYGAAYGQSQHPPS